MDRLASIAQQLACRVRDDNAEANARWLAAVTTPEERDALLYMLAGAIPDDRPWLELTAWARERQPPKPGLVAHGSRAAIARHDYHGEPYCELCRCYARGYEQRRRDLGRPQGHPQTPHRETSRETLRRGDVVEQQREREAA